MNPWLLLCLLIIFAAAAWITLVLWAALALAHQVEQQAEQAARETQHRTTNTVIRGKQP